LVGGAAEGIRGCDHDPRSGQRQQAKSKATDKSVRPTRGAGENDSVQGVQDVQGAGGVGGVAVYGAGGAQGVQGIEAVGRFVGLRRGH